MAAKPIVDGIEREVAGKAQVVRLDIHASPGKETAEKYAAAFVPTYIVFDEMGNETWRATGQPDRQQILAKLKGTP